MRLLGAKFDGFKRLSNTSVRLDEVVVAIVGPNEAGKSSLLSALVRLEDDAGFAPSELTRGRSLAPSHVVVEAWYSVEDDDRAKLPRPELLDKSAVYILEKRADGARVARLQPTPQRDHGARVQVALDLYDFAQQVEGDPSDPSSVAQLARSVGARLDVEDGDLAEDAVQSAEGLMAQLDESSKLRGQLAGLVEAERTPNPASEAIDALTPLRPTSLAFGPAERTLESAYDLNRAVAEQPAALHLLARLAELDLGALSQAQATGDDPRVHTLTNDAARVLERKLNAAWRQSELEVGLRVSPPWLHVLIRDKDGQFVAFQDRSEGLRSFVSLFAFVSAQTLTTKPVLLIDEADAHLHYDAQADLVYFLERQEVAQSVIYTTHSPGCLPEDVGAGIRAVRQTGRDASVIEDSIWRKSAGLTPVLLAIGASSAAFTPARRAVLTEGASDAILLPTVMRQAAGRALLGYQVAPGLSIVGAKEIPELDLEAARVAYLVDGDAGGSSLATKLRDAGIPANRIFTLGDVAPGLAIEDLVTDEAYVEAANQELSKWGKGNRLQPGDLSSPKRSGQFAAWCEARKLSTPYKPAVAARLVEIGRARQIVDPKFVKKLQSLDKGIAKTLRVIPEAEPRR